MNTLRTVRAGAPRIKTLAACLALALSAGAGMDAVSAAPGFEAPHSNQAVFASQAGAVPVGQRNQPNAGLQRPASSSSPSAITRYVRNCKDDGSADSLRTVIGAAADGDTIDMVSQLACSTITLQQGQIPIHARGLTLKGPGQEHLAINGNNAQMFNAIPDFSVPGDVWNQSLTIENLTLTNGNYQYGGCIYVGGDLTLSYSTVAGCRAGNGNQDYIYGGGVDIRGDLTMIHSTVSGNVANGKKSAFGGGVYVGRTASLTASSITGNYALAHGAVGQFNHSLGGGLAAIGAVSISQQSAITNNSARATDGAAYGGGVAMIGPRSSTTTTIGTIDHSTISGNSAYSQNSWSYGGGINAGMGGKIRGFIAKPGALNVGYSTISGNSATSNCANCVIVGGGANAFGEIKMTNSTVNANRAVSSVTASGWAYGGGLATRLAGANGAVRLTQSTVSGNTAAGRPGSMGGYGRGGGVAALLSPFVLTNSTVAFNNASTSGGGVFMGGAVTTSLMNSSIVASNQALQAPDIGSSAPFANSSSVTISGGNNLLIAASANIALPVDTIRADPMLRALASNGGPTQTHELPAGSLAVKAGANPNGYVWDQRGRPYMRGPAGNVDIGAFQRTSNTDFIFVNSFSF